MSTDIARVTSSELAIGDEQTFWNDKQIAALHQLGVKDAPNGDLAVFFHQAKRTGLDPFARQIYMIGRWSKDGTKYTIQTAIDGFRLIASRTGQLDGFEETLWCGEDGQWHDVWLAPYPPAAAKVTVLRDGARYPAVALFREYAQTKRDGNLTQMWAEKGALMIAKCAEALALRKAFPQDLSGLYTSDEMARSNEHGAQRVEAEQVPQCPIPADFADKIAAATNVEWLEWARKKLDVHAADWPAEVAELLALIDAREAALAESDPSVDADEAVVIDDAPVGDEVAEDSSNVERETSDDVVDGEVVESGDGAE